MGNSSSSSPSSDQTVMLYLNQRIDELTEQVNDLQQLLFARPQQLRQARAPSSPASLLDELLSTFLHALVGTTAQFLAARFILFPALKALLPKPGSRSNVDPSTSEMALLQSIAQKRNIKNLTLDSYEMQLVSGIIDLTKDAEDHKVAFLNGKWQKMPSSFDYLVGGHAQIKKTIVEAIVHPFKYPELYNKPNSLLKPPKGILLYGPPGTGKTLIAKCIALECNCTFINVQREQLQNFLLGDSEKLIAALFSLAEKLAPTIIFIDEIESLLQSRNAQNVYSHESRQNQLSIMLSLWDGFFSNSESKVIIIGATNNPHSIDAAAMRRMPIKLHVALPTSEERVQILKVLLKNEKLAPKFNFKTVADSTESMSGSDLKELCKQALNVAATEYIEEMEQLHLLELGQLEMKLRQQQQQQQEQQQKQQSKNQQEQEQFPETMKRKRLGPRQTTEKDFLSVLAKGHHNTKVNPNVMEHLNDLLDKLVVAKK